jgi:hypothetical protein
MPNFKYEYDGSGNVIGSNLASTEQTATASTAGAASVDFSSGSFVYVNGDASFNLTIIDTTSLQDGVLYVIIIKNTTVGQITVTDGLTSATNIASSFVLDTGEYLRLEIFNMNSELHVVGGAAS